MKFFYDLRIAGKLMLAFGAVLALTAALGSFAIFELAQVNRSTQDIAQNWLPSVRAVLEMKAATGRHRSVVLQHILSGDPARMDQYEKRIADFAGEFQRNQAEFEARLSSPEERQAYGVLAPLWQQYVAESDKLVALARQQKSEEALTSSRGESARLATAVHTQIGKLVELNLAGSNRAGAAAEALYASVRLWLLVGLALVMIVGLGLALAIARIVARPLQQAVSVAQAVAKGDLTSRIGVTSNDETGLLLQALAQMNAGLQQMVGEVRGGAHTIATASGQIAAGNLDLSSRTEEQASSLEETAASMEQLTATVSQNAENVHQASVLAGSASAIAVRGGTVVAEVAATMAGIDASARQIASITGVVDAIAFQTNILALNAAVEAARAGEQGRGFAVVASEVRSLAQRSAAAAKEIKQLIDDSVQKVGAGTRLAGQAGATMEEIVGSVKRVTDIMGEIGAATHEQRDGILQINQAIMQMDQVTQQNASLVEEAAAASASMQEQALLLSQAVSAFVLDAGAAPAAARVARTAGKRGPARLEYQ